MPRYGECVCVCGGVRVRDKFCEIDQVKTEEQERAKKERKREIERFMHGETVPRIVDDWKGSAPRKQSHAPIDPQ